MLKITPSDNPEQWPRQAVKSVQCRPRDLVIRITDWMDDADEPGFDVEVYIGGVYDFDESESFTVSSGKTPAQCKAAATEFAHEQIARLL